MIYYKEIKDIIKKYPGNYSKRIKNHNTIIYDCIMKNTKHLDIFPTKLKERIYCYVNDIKDLTLCYCGNKLEFIDINKGYRKFCSKSCKHQNMIKYTPEEYKEYIFNNTTLEVLGTYTRIFDKIEHVCRVCGYKFLRFPSTTIKGAGCSKCYNKSITKSHEEYIRKLPSNIVCLGEYKNAKTKILHKNSNCNHTWMARPNDVLCGLTCPTCSLGSFGGIKTKMNDIIFDSIFEGNCYKELLLIFDKENIELKKKYPNSEYISDFYIKDLDLWIEVSTYRHKEYFEKIFNKRKLVDNFYFASSLKELRIKINELQY